MHEQVDKEIVYSWRDIQTQSYNLKPTPEMIYLPEGDIKTLKILLKNELRNQGYLPFRQIKFDKHYVYALLANRFFSLLSDLTPTQIMNLLIKSYKEFLSNKTDSKFDNDLFLGEIKVYKLHGKAVVRLEDLCE